MSRGGSACVRENNSHQPARPVKWPEGLSLWHFHAKFEKAIDHSHHLLETSVFPSRMNVHPAPDKTLIDRQGMGHPHPPPAAAGRRGMTPNVEKATAHPAA